MLGNPIGWFEIYVNDMARATAFYQTVMAIELEPLTDPCGNNSLMAFPGTMESYGACGALVCMPDMQPGGSGTLVYFSCEDCAVEAGRVEAAGGKLLQAIMAIGEYGFIAIAQDSEGNQIGLHSKV